MILYLDTSAWVKLYVEERGSERVSRAVDQAELVATHLVAYVEMRAALGRKRRTKEASELALQTALREAEADWEQLHRLPFDEALVRRAGQLADQYDLRAYDAVHLAAAETLRAAVRVAVTFACFDERLGRAATEMGFEGVGDDRTSG